MLTSDPLFKFPLVREVIVHGLFEIILHGFWLKILKQKQMSITTFLQVVRVGGMIFSKVFYVKTRENLDSHENFT